MASEKQLCMNWTTENPEDTVIIGAGIHDLCVDPDHAHEFWQLSLVKKFHKPGNYDEDSYDNDLGIFNILRWHQTSRRSIS